MKVIKNQTMIQSMSSMLAKNEMSNVAMVLQSPTLLAEWFVINANLTTSIDGLQNVDDYIDPSSPVIYDSVDDLPLYGADAMVIQAQFDEEVGYDEDFQSSLVIYPNTIHPKPNEFFVLKGSEVTALYVVTDTKPVTVRSNPFIEVTYRLYSRDQKVIDQLRRQVRDHYTVALSAIGLDKTLVIKKESMVDIEKHVRAYLEIAQMYKMLFYDNNKSAFVYDGLPDPETGVRTTYIDMTLWRFMFDEGIVIYDDVTTFAINNMGLKIEQVFTSSPDIYVGDHELRRSILWRIYTQDQRPNFDEYRFPWIYEPTARITKYQGLNIWYLDTYTNQPSAEPIAPTFQIWDDEFICRIRNNDLYEEFPLRGDYCNGCSQRCYGKPVLCYNPYLRNVIIKWFNGEEIDWDNVQLVDTKTIENYYLIPLVLGIYKKFIHDMQ